MGLLQYFHAVLEEMDYGQTSVKLTVSLISLTFSIIVYILSGVISKLSYTYANLTQKEKVFWNSGIVRSIFGIYIAIFCTWGILVDKDLEEDVISKTSSQTYVLILTTIGFLIFECLLLTWSNIKHRKLSFLLQIHHWMTLLMCAQGIMWDYLHFFYYRIMILEMSAPFTTICWILLKAGKGNSTIWRVNQHILIHVFHLRSFLEVSLCYYVMIKYRTEIISELPSSMVISGYAYLVLLTCLLTPYWTYKKTMQLFEPKEFDFPELEQTRQSNGHIVKKSV